MKEGLQFSHKSSRLKFSPKNYTGFPIDRIIFKLQTVGFNLEQNRERIKNQTTINQVICTSRWRNIIKSWNHNVDPKTSTLFPKKFLLSVTFRRFSISIFLIFSFIDEKKQEKGKKVIIVWRVAPKFNPNIY